MDFVHLTLEGLLVLAALLVLGGLLAAAGVPMRPDVRRPTCRRCGEDLRPVARALAADGGSPTPCRCPGCDAALAGRRVRWRSPGLRLRPVGLGSSLRALPLRGFLLLGLLLLGLLLLGVAGALRVHGWSLESRGVGWEIHTAPWVVERLRRAGERGDSTIADPDWAVLQQTLHAGALGDEALRVVTAQIAASKATRDWRLAPLPMRTGVAAFLGEACAQSADPAVRASIARAAGVEPILSIVELRPGAGGLEIEFLIAEAELGNEAALGGWVRALAAVRSVEVDGRPLSPRLGSVVQASPGLRLYGLPGADGPNDLGVSEARSMVVRLDAGEPAVDSTAARGDGMRTLAVELDVLVLERGLARRIDDGWPAPPSDWATVGPVRRERCVATFAVPAPTSAAPPSTEPAR